jgi:ankyrin repeat protein
MSAASLSPDSGDINEFIQAACVPLDSGHATGSLEEAEAILAAHPQIPDANIYTAAILGNEAAIRRFLAVDSTNATTKGGPRNWDALTHLCFSRYLRLDPARSDAFVHAATALLDAGASANTGWYEINHQPNPGWESVLYGAAGVAHHEGLTRLLLERGADPNDGEVSYHAPEGWDNAALKALVQSGRMTPESLATMLLRKADWHDFEGIKYLLEHGADPNLKTDWGYTALHQALRRDNAIENIAVILDHGGDPTLENRSDAKSACSIAARRGRADALELFERRGFRLEFKGVEKLIAACARNDDRTIDSIRINEPNLLSELLVDGGTLLAEFAGVGNTRGVRQLLDLGVPVAAIYQEGDGYFGVAEQSTALHVAAWRARHETVKLLIERGTPINLPDGNGRTPLALAVLACVDSYWTERRSPESVEALLQAGASVTGVRFPSGYAEVDELIRNYTGTS